jgi:OST-HTH/LOTUS domain
MTTDALLEVQRRIVQLVQDQGGAPLNISLLPDRYKQQYKKNLDHKTHGFPKLKALVNTTPSIKILSKRGKPDMLVLVGPSRSKQNNKAENANRTTCSVAVEQEMTPSHSLVEIAGILLEGREDKDLHENKQLVEPNSSNRLHIEDFLETALNATSETTVRSHHSYLANAIDAASAYTECALLGSLHRSADNFSTAECGGTGMLSEEEEHNTVTPPITPAVFLNTNEPFCLTAIGVQGAGKSHTLACVLESCLIPAMDVVRLSNPMTALVLHYDQTTTSVCEAAGLLSPSPTGHSTAHCIPRSKSVVLVSPTFYKQRKAFYGEYCSVRPLLFRWCTLSADHIKRIMRIQSGDNQLYVASFMTLLRSYQRQGVVPNFAQFIDQVKEVCNIKGQQGAIDQRNALLESMVAELDVNTDIVGDSLDVIKALSSDLQLIIADMTDPLLSKEEANRLFQVITSSFVPRL